MADTSLELELVARSADLSGAGELVERLADTFSRTRPLLLDLAATN